MEVIIVNSTSNNQDKTPGKILFKQMLSGLEQQYVIQRYDVFVKMNLFYAMVLKNFRLCCI